MSVRLAAVCRVAAAVIVLLLVCAGNAPAQTWVLKVPFNGLGNSLAVNPWNSDVVYGSPGSDRLYRSYDRGHHWLLFGNAFPLVGTEANIIKSLAISPTDTTRMLIGVESSGAELDRILKSTNGGLSWVTTWSGSFSYYGQPVEFKPQHPDTVYTMGNDTLFRSTDFGSTWTTVMVSTGTEHFTAWCDAEMRPDSAAIMLLGDAATGIWKTTDHGATWRRVYTAISTGEIPSIAVDPFNTQVAYASRFSGGGGLMKSTDGGETWFALTTPVGLTSAWWVTCSTVSPGYVVFGAYSANPGGVHVSADGGLSWRTYKTGLTSVGNFNYGLLVLDTLTIVAAQGNGINKLVYPSSILVQSPNGGERYAPGKLHTVSWSASYLDLVKIELSTDDGASWSLVADSLAAAAGSYTWAVPATPSAQCRLRVSDARFTATADTSDSTFAIEELQLLSPAGGELWYAGALHPVEWTAADITTVDLELSSDGGGTWEPIATRPAASSGYLWWLPGVTSDSCLVRVRDHDDSSRVDVSDSVFAIRRVVEFQARLVVSDGGGASDTLDFGAAGGATDAIDTSLGEQELGPPPGPGMFDARWEIPGSNGVAADFRDTIGVLNTQNVYDLRFQPGGGGYPVSLTWTPESLKAESYILRDVPTGGRRLIRDMRMTGSAVVQDSTVGPVEIIECRSSGVSYQANGGWALLSIPVVTGQIAVADLFPYAVSQAYAFANGYVSVDTLLPGQGYWLKFDQATIVGCELGLDTTDLRPGWNMVGSVSTPVPVSAVSTLPAAIISSNFFGYTTGYTIADTIMPGSGYWVKATQAGKLVLDASAPAAPAARPAGSLLAELHRLTVSSSLGGRQALFFGPETDEAPPHGLEMPSQAPPGGFDARFTSNFLAEIHPRNVENSLEYPILINAPEGEINFSWNVENEENFLYILAEKSGNTTIAKTPLRGTGDLLVQFHKQSSYSLYVQQAIGTARHPAQYELGELYPNPFNPSARVPFSLPSDADVTIKVFSVLGQDIATLFEGPVSAGLHEIRWDVAPGGTVGSGVYFVRMEARARGTADRRKAFVGVQKIVFLK